VKPLFVDAWETVRNNGMSPRIVIRPVADSRIFITEDQPSAVLEAIDELTVLAARSARGGRRP
jgi:hypothetical protein